MSQNPPPARGQRLPWSDLPAETLAALEGWLGDRVESAQTQPGGFSPAIAARLRTAAGRRVFVKAVPPGLNPDAPDIYRQEARVVSALPPHLPVPRLLWTRDEGPDGWVVLVFEDVAGHNPAYPWQAAELDRVMAALIRLSDDLTPAPIEARPAGEEIEHLISGWGLLTQQPAPDLDPWSARNLDQLAELEKLAPKAVEGTTLLHCDVRADNLILTPERVYLVDWPGACVGAPWFDIVGFAPSVTMQGGPDPETLLLRHPAARQADPERITAAVAALAGYFTQRALQPAPPGLPTLRPFQAAQGEVARAWLARRTGWK